MREQPENAKCSPHEACLRLIAAWCDRLNDNSDFAEPLSSYLTEANITQVMRLGLFSQYSKSAQAEILGKTDWKSQRGDATLRRYLRQQGWQ
jgi:hypothetical protein